MQEANVGVAERHGAVRSGTDTGSLGLEELYDRYADSLFRYALALTRSADDAEDAVQEVFARLSRRKLLTDVDNIRAYLFKATRNAAYSALRGKRRTDELHASLCSETGTGSAGDGVFSIGISEAFAGLPVEQREVLVLKVYDGMTFQEIADAVGASIGTVASRYRYGIARLRQALEEKSDG